MTTEPTIPSVPRPCPSRRALSRALLAVAAGCLTWSTLAPAWAAPDTAPTTPTTPTTKTTPTTPSPTGAAAASGAQESATLPCTSAANVLKTARVQAPGVTGSLPVVTDGRISVEGAFWSSGETVVLPKDRAALRYDLGGVQLIKAFLLQGDNNEEYILEGSTDGVIFTKVWTAPATFVGMGLRTRSVVLKEPVAVRYLRVKPVGGDGFYSVSELQAFCQVPAAFPPALRLPPKKFGWDAIDNDGMVQVKGVVATLAALLLIASFFRRFYDARINSTVVRAILVGLFMLAAAMSTWLGVMASNGSGPEALVKFAKVSGSAPGWYYSAGILFSSGLALLALFLRKQGPRIFDTSLALVGLFSFFAWWNLGHYHFDHYVHIWEHYHYIMGAKYGPELRYSRLYQCTAAADLADGLTKQVRERKMRRIEADNQLGTTAAVIADPTICTSHFKDPARWEQFRKDIRFFRSHFSAQRWDESQQDHGYNATPVWGILGRFIADRTELTWDNIVKLGIIDSVFLIAMWLAVLWAFGWRAAAVALIYWGCNFPARFYWNGGSFLRYDWMLWMVVGICFLKKKRMALGGAALTYATLLRVFPGFVVATLVLKALAAMVRERRIFLSREHQWFAIGCIVTLGVLIPASSWATDGLDAWAQFAENSQKHLKTALTNNMGLKTVMGYDFATRAINMRNDKLEDPFREWKDAKQHFYSTRAPLFWAIVILFCIMLARAADREENWAAACLGTGLIVIAPELTCYYYGFLLTYGLLWPRRKLPGILAAALAAFTCFIYGALAWNDDHFAAMSLASVVTVVAATAHVAFGKRAQADAPATTPPPSEKQDAGPVAQEPREPSMPPILAEPR